MGKVLVLVSVTVCCCRVCLCCVHPLHGFFFISFSLFVFVDDDTCIQNAVIPIEYMLIEIAYRFREHLCSSPMSHKTWCDAFLCLFCAMLLFHFSIRRLHTLSSVSVANLVSVSIFHGIVRCICVRKR